MNEIMSLTLSDYIILDFDKLFYLFREQPAGLTTKDKDRFVSGDLN